ncbi:ABC transporter ATP-binding protein [Halorientalis pallida]|uniref:ABC transporter ATP-binding protein n=1 Tax=Halorientalis pallida TaxID=2479928 RepID=UPI003C6F59E1
MTEPNTADISLREQLHALYIVALYRPAMTVGIILLSILAALLEGIGLSFLVPIIEIAQGTASRGELSRMGQAFLDTYAFLGIPFTLEFIVAGVALVMIVRYTSSFLVDWFRAALQTDYVRHLQTTGLDHALDAEIAYYDEKGSDEVLNAIVTQSEYAARVIRRVVRLVEQGALSLVYLGVALYIAPQMTVLTAILLGVILFLMRYVVESGYAIGDRIADANERIHESAQAGTQGIRDVKVFGLVEEVFADFTDAVDQFYRSRVRKARNEAAMDNVYQMLTAVTVFALIYFALEIVALTVAALGIFLFAVFRLAPRVSTLNNLAYRTAGDLPHLVRTQRFIDELAVRREPDDGAESTPETVESVAFEEVSFAYDEELVLRNVSFGVDRGEFVAFVGPSGAGKSTVVSLLTRLYDPDSGRITANGTDVQQFDLDAWRADISMVRQDPFIFNDTVRYNVTIGNREASEAEIQEVCELAQVTEFLEDLPNGLDTVLGDDGVRLSGGQRQRIAIARALLKDADVLVMDEATSDLDTSLEENIQANLEASEQDRILIVIAHRLSTVVNADRIYAMEDGRITESGTHDDLVEEGGTYAELYASQ